MAKKSRRVAAASAASRAAERSHVAPRRASRRPDVVRQRKEARRIQYERQQRQWRITKIVIGAIALAVIVALGFAGFRQFQQWQVTRDVEEYFTASDFVGAHNDNEPILYEQIPPTGGVHRQAWQNCGFYSEFINNENGVHALEHGAVWITYDPDLPQDQIDTLAAKANQDFILVSPYPGMDAPVVASVWGKQIKLDGADDPRLDAFIREYRKNPDNSPEPLGVCYGGISATTDQVPQQEPYVRADPDGPPVGGIKASDATATAQAALPATPAASPIASPGSPPATPVDPLPAATPATTPAASAPEPAAEG
jgi:hypothetical protein